MTGIAPPNDYPSPAMTDAHTGSLAAETIRESSLYNKDLAPVAPERRTWRTYNYAALWISMSVNIPT